MSTTFRRDAPEPSLLLPPDVREWLPKSHLAHHVSDLVDGLDLTAFYAGNEGDGQAGEGYAVSTATLFELAEAGAVVSTG